jgi:ABC-type Mn2+/Zn2+ transport system permease subunit
MLGVVLRPRGEAVAAFSYAQVAVLGAMLAVLSNLPPLVGAWLLALAAGLGALWRLGPPGGGSRHLMLLALAWAVGLLVADNHPEAQLLSLSAIEGQLLLVRWSDWPGFLLLCLVGAGVLLAVGKRWFAMQLVPWRARGGGRISALREVAVVSLLAAGALGLGVFVTLALVVVPAWAVWARAGALRLALLGAGALALAAHLGAFVLALLFDQVYSAVLVVVLVMAGLALRAVPTRRSRPGGV